MNEVAQLPAVYKPRSIVDMLLPRAQINGSLPGPTDNFWYEDVPATNAGQKVTGRTALTFSGCWAATNALAGLFGALPCKVYRQTADGREEAIRHDTYRLLGAEPNPKMDSFVWWEMMTQWWINYGNAFAEIQRTEMGRVFALWPIHPTRVRPELDGKSWTGRWMIRNDEGEWNYLDEADVLNIIGHLSDNGLTGKGVIYYAAQAIGVGLAQQKYEGDFYDKGGRPSGVLMHKSTLSDKARADLRREWQTIHREGNEIAILFEGTEYQSISVDPEHMKLKDAEVGTIQDMCRFYDLPPHVLYELSNGTFANTEEMNRFLVSQPMLRRTVRVEKALDRQLFTEAEKKQGYRTKFNMAALLRGTPKEQAEVLSIGLSNGVINQDEWRAHLELNKLPKGLGETYWMKRDMAPIELVQAAAEKEINAPSAPIPDTPPTPATPPTPPTPNGDEAENRLRDRISALRGRVGKLTAHLRSEKTDFSACIGRQRDEIASRNDTISALASECDSLRNKLADEQQKRGVAVERLKESDAEIAALASEKGEVQSELDALTAERDSLSSKLTDANDQLATERKQHEVAVEWEKESREVAAELTAEKVALESRIESICGQIATLEAEKKAIYGELESERTISACVPGLEQECERARQSAADALVRAESAESSCDEATARATALAQEHSEAIRQLAKVRKESAILEKQRESLGAKLEKAEHQLQSEKTAHSEAKQALKQAERVIADAEGRLSAERASGNTALSKATKRGDDFKARVDALSSEIGALRAERDALGSRVGVLEKSRDELADALAESKKNAESATNAAETAENEAKLAESAAQQQLEAVRLGVAASFRTILGESLDALIANEAHEARVASRKPDQFKEVVNGFYLRFTDSLRVQLAACAESLEALGASRVDVQKIAAQYVAESRTRLNNVFHTTNRADLRVAVRKETESWADRRQTLLDWIGGQ